MRTHYVRILAFICADGNCEPVRRKRAGLSKDDFSLRVFQTIEIYHNLKRVCADGNSVQTEIANL